MGIWEWTWEWYGMMQNAAARSRDTEPSSSVKIYNPPVVCLITTYGPK
jgi:hypothetical protein